MRQVDHHGGFTAAAGHALYTARTYPKHYWNRTAFVSEPTGHLTATFTLHREEGDFVARNAWNLVASDDEWTAPIMAEVGPDGHVWVIDWYNYIVQHNPTPAGFKTGKGNAYETPLRDKTHGRIYRDRLQGRQADRRRRRSTRSDPEGLVAALKNDNLFWRMHAQRLLVERGKRDVVPALIRLVQDRSVDAIGLNPAAIHALWTLHGLGALDGPDPAAREAAEAALEHPSAGVRRNALEVLPRDERSAARVLASGALRDEDSFVRLSALLALAEMPASEEVAGAITEAILAGNAGHDVPLTRLEIEASARLAQRGLAPGGPGSGGGAGTTGRATSPGGDDAGRPAWGSPGATPRPARPRRAAGGRPGGEAAGRGRRPGTAAPGSEPGCSCGRRRAAGSTRSPRRRRSPPRPTTGRSCGP